MLHSLRIPLGMQLLGEMDGYLYNCIQISLSQKFQEIRFPKGFLQLLKYVLSFFPLKLAFDFSWKNSLQCNWFSEDKAAQALGENKKERKKAQKNPEWDCFE